jgi:DNA-directed RNA polymerase subunit RPC12/RpoP
MYEGESEQLSKVMRKNKNPKSVPIVCDKCSYESEVSMKQWEEHWHGVEYKCPECNHTLIQEDNFLQHIGSISGVISKNKKTPDAICKNCGYDSEKTWNEMDKHRWGVEYKCPECDFLMFKDKPKLYKMASEEGLIDYSPKENAKAYIWMLILILPWIILLYLAGSK